MGSLACGYTKKSCRGNPGKGGSAEPHSRERVVSEKRLKAFTPGGAGYRRKVVVHIEELVYPRREKPSTARTKERREKKSLLYEKVGGFSHQDRILRG